MDDVTTFFADQSARVRGGKLFGGATTAAAAMTSANRSMAAIKFPAPRMARAKAAAERAWVASDDGAAKFAAGLIGILPKTLQDAFRAEIVPWARHVIEQWPVRSGKSRDALFLSVDADDSLVKWTLYGAAPYTYMVGYQAKGKDEPSKRDRDIYAYIVKRHGVVGSGVGNQVQIKPDILKYTALQFGTSELGIYNVAQRVSAFLYRNTTGNSRTVYRLPDGTDAKGLNAWQWQARKPFPAMFERMSRRTGVALGRNAKELAERMM